MSVTNHHTPVAKKDLTNPFYDVWNSSTEINFVVKTLPPLSPVIKNRSDLNIYEHPTRINEGYFKRQCHRDLVSNQKMF